jgi:hypothetical protein
VSKLASKHMDARNRDLLLPPGPPSACQPLEEREDEEGARGTRTVKRCSPGTRARRGALGVGRVRILRVIEDVLASPSLSSPSHRGGEREENEVVSWLLERS